jgi:5-methylcytosine-specific restriction endonuclease McrA
MSVRNLAQRNTWIKEHGPCQRCGTWDNLEIDHIDPTAKEIDVYLLWGRADYINQELDKCQVLCHTCHLEKTKDDNSTKAKHGTLTIVDVLSVWKQLQHICVSTEDIKSVEYYNTAI